jgi:diadenosine tetraphosphatase ApaH/serine/threonine PP2A family protein phosphatase
VGQPRDGDARACYAILEEDRVTWRRVQYDFRPTQKKIREVGLPEALARRLELGR